MLKAGKSLETAEIKFKEAMELLQANFFGARIITAYASMFHSARGLLYKDGIQEKSHYCAIAYVKENYVRKGIVSVELITVMNSFREERHDIMYGFAREKAKRQEAEAAVENAEKMIKAIKKLI